MLLVKVLISIGFSSVLWGQITNENPIAVSDSVDKHDERSGFKYRANFIFYHQDGDSLVLRGDVEVRRGAALLEAGEMVYYRTPDILVARVGIDSSGEIGSLPVLKHGEEILTGSQIIFDMTSGSGKINCSFVSANLALFKKIVKSVGGFCS